MAIRGGSCPTFLGGWTLLLREDSCCATVARSHTNGKVDHGHNKNITFSTMSTKFKETTFTWHKHSEGEREEGGGLNLTPNLGHELALGFIQN